MAKKAIKLKGADQNGSAETSNSQSTVVQDVKLEVVKASTLAELETAVQNAAVSFRDGAWAFAVAITAVHDSKLYPGADVPFGFYAYMVERWSIRKAQAANYVAWVKQEIKMELMLLNPAMEDIQSTKVDSLATPAPAEPQHKSVTKARAARKSNGGTRGKGIKYFVVTKEDGKWSTKLVSATTAKEKGLTTFSNLTEAERMLERMEQQEKEQAQTVTRPTAELNQKEVALTPAKPSAEMLFKKLNQNGWWSTIAEGQLNGEEEDLLAKDLWDVIDELCAKYSPHERAVMQMMMEYLEYQKEKDEVLEVVENADAKEVEDVINEAFA